MGGHGSWKKMSLGCMLVKMGTTMYMRFEVKFRLILCFFHVILDQVLLDGDVLVSVLRFGVTELRNV